MNRRNFLRAGFAATASGLLIPEPIRAYSFLPGCQSLAEREAELQDFQQRQQDLVYTTYRRAPGSSAVVLLESVARHRGLKMLVEGDRLHFVRKSVREALRPDP